MKQEILTYMDLSGIKSVRLLGVLCTYSVLSFASVHSEKIDDKGNHSKLNGVAAASLSPSEDDSSLVASIDPEMAQKENIPTPIKNICYTQAIVTDPLYRSDQVVDTQDNVNDTTSFVSSSSVPLPYNEQLDGNICHLDEDSGMQHDDNSPSFEWGITLLYLQPNIDDSHYVLTSIDNTFNGSLFPRGNRHPNTASFAPGFSLEGYLPLCSNSSLGLRFTDLMTHTNDTRSGPFLYDTSGFPGFGAQDSPVYSGTARSKNSYTFYAGDITYHRGFAGFCPDSLTLIMGIHAACIKFKEQVLSLGTFLNDDQETRPLSNDMRRDSQFYALGPQLGLDYELPFYSTSCSSWSIRAEARGALLCGNTRGKLTYVTLRTGPGGVVVNNGDLWRITPAARSELGVCYHLNSSSLNFTLECGYEFLWYDKCMDKIIGLETAFAGDTFDYFNAVTFQGPYLRLSGSF